MAKSNRRRKLDRAKRQVRDARKRVIAERRLAADEVIQSAIARYGRLLKPDASVTELVDGLDEIYHGDAVSMYVVNRMQSSGLSLDRLAEVAEAILASGGLDGHAPSLTALTFAAEVARSQPRRSAGST